MDSRIQRRKKLRKAEKLFFTMLCVVVLLCCIVVAAFEIQARLETRRMDDDVRKLYPHSGALSFSLLPSAHAEEMPEMQADFKDLYATNPDVVGWLNLGENIDYPVVQRDNSFYLTHNFNQKSDSNGAVFINEFNSLWPRDDVLLVHGHNMKSGAMFGKLSEFSSKYYLYEHPIVTFRTIYDEEDVYYIPFAAFNASMDEKENGYFDVMRINFEHDAQTEEVPEDADMQAYLKEVRKKSVWKPLIEVDENDELLVLLTCSYEHKNGRFLLFCRKMRDDETLETVTALFEEAGK